jgi:hypothetical protein
MGEQLEPNESEHENFKTKLLEATQFAECCMLSRYGVISERLLKWLR